MMGKMTTVILSLIALLLLSACGEKVIYKAEGVIESSECSNHTTSITLDNGATYYTNNKAICEIKASTKIMMAHDANFWIVEFYIEGTEKLK